MVEKAEGRVRIKEVVPGGIGEAVGIQVGDVIEAINGEPIRDPIDYRFHIGDEAVEVHLRRGEEPAIFDIEKDADEDLGIVLDDMPILKCNNKCVFCFLHQMPRGMRKTLYYQDDDYRLSFLHGAYVTLTNLSEEEFRRVVDQRLSPMYISVHATHPDLRGQLLGRSEPVDVMERIQFLARHNIQMHTQVVLCPGINDGPHLKRTVFDLAACYPDVASVGIVPLGLTRYRKNLPELHPVTPEVAVDCVDRVTGWQERLKRRLGINFVYLGDEFYILAGRELPDRAHYDGFPLLENGVGMVRRFIDAFEEGVADLESVCPDPLRATLVTSVLGAGFMRRMVDRLNRLSWLNVHLIEVRNRFLGSGITVSGLLTGGDMRDALKARWAPADVVVLPPNCISHTGVFLDDLTPSDLSENLGCEVLVGSYDLVETLKDVVKGRGGWEVGRETGEATHPYISSRQVV